MVGCVRLLKYPDLACTRSSCRSRSHICRTDVQIIAGLRHEIPPPNIINLYFKHGSLRLKHTMCRRPDCLAAKGIQHHPQLSILRFYGLSQALCDSRLIKGCPVMRNRPRGSDDFASDDDQRGRRAPSLRAVRFVDRFPDVRFDG